MRIKETLLERGMTAKELCRRLGVSETWLSLRIKSNRFTLPMLRGVADALECNVSDLLRDEDKYPRGFTAVIKDGEKSYVAGSWSELRALADKALSGEADF